MKVTKAIVFYLWTFECFAVIPEGIPMGAEFRDSRRKELGIIILSDFEAVWVQHVTGSNACRWYLEHF